MCNRNFIWGMMGSWEKGTGKGVLNYREATEAFC